MDAETKLKNVFDMNPTMTKEKAAETFLMYMNLQECEVESGFNKCLSFMKDEAYLETAFMKMYNINPVSTGITQVRYNVGDQDNPTSVEIDVAILTWTNGAILVYRAEGVDDSYNLIRLPKVKQYTLPKVDSEHEQKG